MADPVRLLGIVPARGGSKRVPRKNVLPLAGRPLIAWTLAAARDSGVLVSVLVSTDDEDVARVARDEGIDVPWMRPAHLATDTATSADVVADALARHERNAGQVDAIVLLQPTSPFRTAASIRAAADLYRAGDLSTAVVSVSPVQHHPAWCFRDDGGSLIPFLGWESLGQRSQDLPPAFALNGALYVVPAAQVRHGGPLLQPGMRTFVMRDPVETLDIDTPEDWREAERHAVSRTPPPPFPP